jgi:hypothetical protein
MGLYDMGLGPAWGPFYTGFPVKTLKEIVDELEVTHMDILKIGILGS